jgi:hypothetical protein
MKEYHESLSSVRENDGKERVYQHCQQVKDSGGSKKGVGVAENPRSGVGARGSSVKKGRMYGKICCGFLSIVLPLLNLLILMKELLKIRKPIVCLVVFLAACSDFFAPYTISGKAKIQGPLLDETLLSSSSGCETRTRRRTV